MLAVTFIAVAGAILNDPVLLPPPLNTSVPPCTLTVALLLNGMAMVVVPAMGREHFFALFSVANNLALGLAPILVHAIFEAIEAIHRQGTPVLLVEQNAMAALKHSNRAYVLETGTVSLEGTSDEVAANPKVKEAYLGE